MVTIICNAMLQYNIQVEDMTEEDIKSMSDEEIGSLVESMVGTQTYDNEYGEIHVNDHTMDQYEILNEDEESIRNFENNID